MTFKEQNPIYIQIAERICDEILEGRYPEGERLPSVREYAIQVEVNVNTLVRSYDWLSQNDIIFNRRGLLRQCGRGRTHPRGTPKRVLPTAAARNAADNAVAGHLAAGSGKSCYCESCIMIC